MIFIRHLCFLFLFILTCSHSYAQWVVDTTVIPFRQDSLWAYANLEGELVTELSDTGFPGLRMIPEPGYAAVLPYLPDSSEYIRTVQGGLHLVKLNTRPGHNRKHILVDNQGKEQTEGFNYYRLYQGNLMAVLRIGVGRQEDSWYVPGKKNKFKQKIPYHLYGEFSPYGQIRVSSEQGRAWVDSNFQLLSGWYDDVEEFYHGYSATVRWQRDSLGHRSSDRETWLMGAVDRTGKEVHPCTLPYHWSMQHRFEGRVGVEKRDYEHRMEDQLCGPNGEVLFKAVEPFFEIEELSSGQFMAKSSDSCILFSETGQPLFTTTYYPDGRPAKPLYRFLSRDKQTLFVNTRGQVILSPTRAKVSGYRYGWARVYYPDSVTEYIDTSGQVQLRIPASQFEECGEFDALGYTWARIGKRKGLIDRKGEVVLPFQFNQIRNSRKSHFYVVHDTLWQGGLIHHSGEWWIRPQYQNVWLRGEVIVIRKNDRWGALDSLGNVLLPPLFKRVNHEEGALFVLEKKPTENRNLAAFEIGSFERESGCLVYSEHYALPHDFYWATGLMSTTGEWLVPMGPWDDIRAVETASIQGLYEVKRHGRILGYFFQGRAFFKGELSTPFDDRAIEDWQKRKSERRFHR